ncbi:MAG: hypothetical protein FD163_2114 [Hyphomonadaceae bacterium]|nr:MAG: hypothetical protein FD128_779 [Hyphomonadaceae bacterium]KAF0183920.1 MAG: hypothetical protein FD163_2114 [Hyphomonadaceae bacterium]
MAYTATVFRVMIAFPSDVTELRDIAREVINDWNNIHSKEKIVVLLPVDWITHSAPELGGRAQGIINEKVLSDCDLLVGIFHNRIGSPTSKEVSGSVEEIKEHHGLGKPAMVYFSTESVNARDVDKAQLDSVLAFEKWCQSKGITHNFDSQDRFREDFNRHLSLTINQHEYFKSILDRNNLAWFSEPDADELKVELSESARELLLAGSEDSHGMIYYMRSFSGKRLSSNETVFSENGSPREVAKWEEAITELENLGLIEDINGKSEIYKLTNTGFDFVDMSNAQL